MATTINFTSDGVRDTCTLKPNGAVVVQVAREDKAYFTVYGNLDGMEKVPMLDVRFEKDLIFKLDVPEGVTVTLESGSRVTEAKMMEVL